MKWITAGESHGRAISAIIEGVPAGLTLSTEEINIELTRRMQGHGRGGRMKIESDHIEILSGVRHGLTLGSPIQLLIPNKDFANWRGAMGVEKSKSRKSKESIHRPRPGHADLAGMLKYDFDDARNVLERASARETAMRVAVGSVARKFLKEFNVTIASHVIAIGEISLPEDEIASLRTEDINSVAEKSSVRCLSDKYTKKMVNHIDKTGAAGDTCGGICEIVAKKLPIGLGSHVHWDRKLDGRIAAVMMSIPAVKGVEIGIGFSSASFPGSAVHDEITYLGSQLKRLSNNAGGLEGGITNGEDIIIRVAMKPISTLKKPLKSVNLKNKNEEKAHFERSDVTAVPACGVVAEAGLALVLMEAFLEKFGCDSLAEIKRNYENYIEYLKKRLEK